MYGLWPTGNSNKGVLNQAHAWFLKIALSVHLCVCLCMCPPQGRGGASYFGVIRPFNKLFINGLAISTNINLNIHGDMDS